RRPRSRSRVRSEAPPDESPGAGVRFVKAAVNLRTPLRRPAAARSRAATHAASGKPEYTAARASVPGGNRTSRRAPFPAPVRDAAENARDPPLRELRLFRRSAE